MTVSNSPTGHMPAYLCLLGISNILWEEGNRTSLSEAENAGCNVLTEATKAYSLFNEHEDDCTKVILKP